MNLDNLVFIDLKNEECEGIWISKESEELSVIKENIVSKGKFEIEGNIFYYVKIFY